MKGKLIPSQIPLSSRLGFGYLIKMRYSPWVALPFGSPRRRYVKYE